MIRSIVFAFSILFLSNSPNSYANCFQDAITFPNPYNGNGGEVIKLMGGTVWKEVSYQYLYLYQYNPVVTICPETGLMILNNNRFKVIPVRANQGNSLNTKKSARNNSSRPDIQSTSSVIESRIDGDFEGWDGNTIFKLLNGQIWQQTSYAYTYHYAFMPNIIIFKQDGAYFLQVEGVSERIMVERLK